MYRGFKGKAHLTWLAAYCLGIAGGLAAGAWLFHSGAFRERPVGAGILLGALLLLPAAAALAVLRARQDRRGAGAPAAPGQDLQETVRRLSKKNEELEEILHAAFHDLRTPLINIQGFSRHLRSACDELAGVLERCSDADELRREALPLVHHRIPDSQRHILAGAETMDALIDGLLGVARLERRPLRPALVDMNTLIGCVFASMTHQIRQTGAEVKADDLPDCWGEDVQVARLFTNLLDNALRYRDPCRPLRVRVRGSIDRGAAVYCVEDTGVGIDAGMQDTIWELFTRLRPDDSPAGEGLGLSMVRRIAERHGGRAWVESEPGSGSRFFVALPQKPFGEGE